MVDVSEQLDRLQTALLASGDVVYDWDLIDDTITWVGRTDALFGDAIQVPSGEAFNDRVYTEDVAARAKAMTAHFSTREGFDCDYRLRGVGGNSGFHITGELGAEEREDRVGISARASLVLGL